MGQQLSLSCSLSVVEEDRRLKIPGKMTKTTPTTTTEQGEHMIVSKQEKKWEMFVECAKYKIHRDAHAH